MQFPMEGLLSRTGGQLGRRTGRGAARRRAVVMREFKGVGGATGCALSRSQSSTPLRVAVLGGKRAVAEVGRTGDT